jgi:arylsulfatase A-like enzyme
MAPNNLHAGSLLSFLAMFILSCNQPQPKAEATTMAQTMETGDIDRTILPIRETYYLAATELDARNAKAPARFEVKAPEKAPNVLVVLIDDQGFSASSAFGGAINEPVLDKMASDGLRYNNFNTTALCSPTRTAILTGYNHHSNNAGAIMEMATGFQGNTGIRPQTITPMAEVLRQNGYSTAAFGKYHETPPWEVSVSGPYDRWPTHSGFDKFYGFIGGETNQWAPKIYDGVTEMETPNTPNYHFTVDMTDRAITWIQGQQALTPDKPFLTYFATGATHAPHHAPKEYIAKNEIRSQFTHAIDIAPTVFEACKIPAPKMVYGVEQRPIEGTSMLYSFNDVKAANQHTTQFFEMFGNRAIYHNGWVARTIHKTPWGAAALNTLDKDVWQLYNVNEDFSETNDLAAANPAKLKELQDLFLKEAVKYNVLPIDDRNYERFDARIAGRPDLMGPRTKLNLYDGMSVSEFAAINVKTRSYTITADVELANANTNGVIVAQAGRFGGWTLYMKAGKLHHEYNWFGQKRTNISSAKALTAGRHTVKYEFVIDAYRPASGGKCFLYVDDVKVAEGYIVATQPFGYSADEGWNVGADHETPVSEDYKENNNKFTGKIKVVTIETFPPRNLP